MLHIFYKIEVLLSEHTFYINYNINFLFSLLK